jgi:hypothetical protein
LLSEFEEAVNIMNHKIGRNDVCSCGSGKKYKKCCMEAETPPVTSSTSVDFKWHQIRQLEGIIVDQHLVPYATKELPDEVIQYALADCFPEDLPEALDKGLWFHQFFLPWFLFNWIPSEDFGLKQFDPEKTIAQNYIKTHEDRLNSQLKRFIKAINQSYYSFYSVLQVEIEKSLLIKDILLGTTHTIKERQGTHQLKRGDVIFSRILTLNDQSIFVGMAPTVVPARYQNDLIDFRQWLIEENNNAELTPEILREESELALLDYFFDIMKVVFDRRLPTLVNTDGELLQFSKSYFKLATTPEEALNHLLPLTLEKNPKEILQGAKKDKSEKIKRIEFPWLVKGNKKHKGWSNTVHGHIIIDQDKLTLETNSQERTQRGKKLLIKYLGDAIAFQKTLIETPEQKLKSLPKSSSGRDEGTAKLLESPEAQEQLKAIAQAHWESWFDEPIPALENKTPREAARTKDGRVRLEALLLQYERHDLEKADNLFKADINYLRRELCLES